MCFQVALLPPPPHPQDTESILLTTPRSAGRPLTSPIKQDDSFRGIDWIFRLTTAKLRPPGRRFAAFRWPPAGSRVEGCPTGRLELADALRLRPVGSSKIMSACRGLVETETSMRSLFRLDQRIWQSGPSRRDFAYNWVPNIFFTLLEQRVSPTSPPGPDVPVGIVLGRFS